MQKYSREIVNEVLAANDIADIVGVSVELKAAGSARLKGLCPFHHEKTPSFVVDRHRQTFHCFGCGKGGDALSFLTEHDGLQFGEALRKLADRGGIRLPAATEQPGAPDFLRSQLLEFNTFVAGYCQAVLQHPQQGAPAREYLKKRQLNEATVRRFSLGYLPDGWTNLLDAAKAKQYSNVLLDASGLFKRGERGGQYDFFRNRLIFPIRDVAGNLVAFGGRDLGGDNPAKYINSPETAVYKKSRVLYGLNEAREAFRREKRAILVEGYIDLLRCFDAGIENVVASCGTALTPEQASLIRRYVPEVVVVYDGDAAGIKAALKGIGILAGAGLSVRAMALPNGEDPDDFIRTRGAEAFRAMMEEAPDFVTFYVRMSGERLRTIEGRTEVAQEIFELLAGMDDTLRVDEYLRQTAREMGLREHACQREFDQFKRKAHQKQAAAVAAVTAVNAPATPENTTAPSVIQDDALFVAALLNDKRLAGVARERLSAVELAPSAFVEVVGRVLEGPEMGIVQDLRMEGAQRLYTAASALDAPNPELAEAMVEKRLKRLLKESLDSQATRVMQELKEAERVRDTGLMIQLAAQKVKLQREIESVGTF
ncbi:MAG: DNA primase [Candidatus Hydrogenedentes bacterium]|nr:DNA primase [Candidatus Hydrogenedentota bacterium]